EFGDLAGGGEIAETVAPIPRINEPEGGELLDHVERQPAERGDLVDRVASGLVIWRGLPDPFEEAPLAHDRHAVAAGAARAVRRPAVGEQRPAGLADDEIIRAFTYSAARCAAVLAHGRKRLHPLHRREASAEGDITLYGRPGFCGRHPSP